MNRTALRTWLLTQALLFLPFLVAASALPHAIPRGGLLVATAGAALVSLALLLAALPVRGRPADLVTASRGVLTCAAAAWAGFEGKISMLPWSLLCLAALLDLADGWCARRFGGSEEGALLDMETDQLGVLVLAMAAVLLADRGPWLLMLPGLKYANTLWLACRTLPLIEPRPRDGNNRTARLVCAFVVGTLLAVTCPAMPAAVATTLGVLAVVALTWSFVGDSARRVAEGVR